MMTASLVGPSMNPSSDCARKVQVIVFGSGVDSSPTRDIHRPVQRMYGEWDVDGSPPKFSPQ